ncbi:MAG: hypothetical protein NPIRA06_23530 [Nitrospirales bacterium]|nr:MAG: hypothetical protein NPIRA06_23530 [Nitrospirales bacterium]
MERGRPGSRCIHIPPGGAWLTHLCLFGRVDFSLVFGCGLGFGATVAEPALNARGTTAENLTNGFFKKKPLSVAVSPGVAIGIATGLVKLIFDLPLVWLVLVGYAFWEEGYFVRTVGDAVTAADIFAIIGMKSTRLSN